MSDKLKTFISRFLAILLALYFINQDLTRQPSISGDKYLKMGIYGVIDTIYEYDRGYPVVSINSQRVTLAVPGGCQLYLQKHDSIAKNPDTKTLATFRKIDSYQQCILWGSEPTADVNGLISKKLTSIK